jgi:glycosyltransferase involved in cell wall biosynthesis
MKDGPLVSIVLPTYNGAKYLRHSIESCLMQTYRNIELIVVDDNSTDNTREIVAGFADDRIKYIRHLVNKRLPTALNTGFANASGEYLTWTSDDNFYLTVAIEKMLSYLKENNCDFVYGAYYSFRNDDLKDAKVVRLPPDSSLKEVNFIRACFLYSRRIREDVGDYNPETELSEDYDYWIRISKKYRICYLPEPLYYYRYHPGALFSKRYWEQGIVKCLVRFKHDIYSKEEAVRDLIDLYARKRKRLVRPFYYACGIFFLRNVLEDLLTAMKNGTQTFTECKQNLMHKILI